MERLARLLSLFKTLVRLHARFWKLWYVSMAHFETLVRLRAFFGNPAAFACPLLKPWYVCLPFVETLFGNLGTLACPFWKPWHVCRPFLETLARLHASLRRQKNSPRLESL